MNKIIPALLLLNAILCAGCKTVEYNPSYIRPVAQSVEPRYPGKLMILTTSSEDQFVFQGHPDSLTGVAWNLKVPFGEITKKASGEIYGHLFQSGYEFGRTADTNRFAITIHPKIEDFAWRMNQLKNIGFAITPQVKMTLDIEMLSSNQSVLLQRQYESGWVDGNSYVLNLTPFDSVSLAIHKTIANLMVDSIRDLDAILRPDASPQPLPKSFSMTDDGMAACIAFWSNTKRIVGNHPPPTPPLIVLQFDWLEGSKIIAADGTFLGRVTKDSVESDSIGNTVGEYGSSVSSTSIFNTVGEYGSSVSSLSPWNTVASAPPKLITRDGLHWGYLTSNQTFSPRIDPAIVIAYVKPN